MRDTPDWSFVMNVARGTGKTTAMVAAAKSIGAVLVVRNQKEAERVGSAHGIEAIGYESRLKMYGIRNPVLFDPDAVACMCMEYERVIAERLRAVKAASYTLLDAL